MKRLAILSAAVLVTVSALSCQQKAKQAAMLPETAGNEVAALKLSDDAAPPTQPALPSGHPAIGEQKPAPLPSGHPDISQMGGGGGSGQLPPNHPGIPSAPKKADAKPVDVIFNLEAVQQTKGAKPIGAVPATLEFYIEDEKVGEAINFNFDESGKASVPAKAVPTGAVGYITVKYQDVEYHAISAVVDGSKAQTKVGIGIFEATDVKPDWQVAMQHVILSPESDGLHVMEMVSVENPTDKSWIGTPGSDGKRSTISFPVPPTSGDILPVQGFKDGYVTLDGDLLVNQLPLTPGATQYRIGYTIPYKDAKAAMSFKTTSPVKHLMVFVPDDGTQTDVKGLQSLGQQEMNGKKLRAFMGMDLPTGAPIELTVGQPSGSNAQQHEDNVRESNMPAVASSTEWSGSGPTSGVATNTATLTVQIAKAVAVAGTVLVLLLAGAILFAKPNKVARNK